MNWKKLNLSELSIYAAQLPLFNQPQWLNVLSATYGFKGQYWLGEEQEVPRLLLPTAQVKPRLFVSLPHLPHAGLLTLPGYMPSDALWKLPKETPHVYLRTLSSQAPQQGMYVMMQLLLKSFPEQLSGRTQAQLHAQAAHFELRPIPLAQFYQAYLVAMYQFGTPPHPLSFFENIQQQFPEHLCRGLFHKSGALAAAAFELDHDDSRVGMWFFTLPNWKDKAGHALYYWLLTCAKQAGKRIYDLGRCKMGDGVYRFKKKMGAQPTAIHYFKYQNGALSVINPYTHTWKQQLWKKMPFSIVKTLGPSLRKHIY